jgi:hypothetical protein
MVAPKQRKPVVEKLHISETGVPKRHNVSSDDECCLNHQNANRYLKPGLVGEHDEKGKAQPRVAED